MRVVLVGTGVLPIPPDGYGGVERTIAEFATALRAAGVDVAVLNHVRQRQSTDEYRFAWELPGLLPAYDGTIVHASTPVVANRLRWAGRPYVYTTHSRHWFDRGGVRSRWGHWLERRAVAGATAFVALTDPLAARVREDLAPRPLPPTEVIPIGVDLARFQPRFEQRLGNTALGVGVVAPFKRWELAAAGLKGTGWRLVLVGPNPDPGYAERVRAAGDQVEITGEVSDSELLARYAGSDLLVHPSSVEVLAGSVVQGLAAGLPVIGGPAVRGLVDDGVTGWLAPSDDPVRFVEMIRARAHELAGDVPRLRALGGAARAAAEARFGWPAVVAAHLRLYDQVAPAFTR
ncbi:MAG TPA: glycosyltransferase family 4 protein [Thermoplasmata archaeon]|nr:glycosyltransferase family 4 protein [Thermoplasmata archaeon]